MWVFITTFTYERSLLDGIFVVADVSRDSDYIIGTKRPAPRGRPSGS